MFGWHTFLVGVSLHREWHESQLYVADLLEGACYATVQSLTPLPCSHEDYASMHDAHYVSARYAAAEAKVKGVCACVRTPIQRPLIFNDVAHSSPVLRAAPRY